MLGPARQGKDAEGFAGVAPGVVEVPQLGSLPAWIPLAERVPERAHALLRAGLLLVAAGAADGGIEAVVTQAGEERLGLQEPAAPPGPPVEGAHAVGDRPLVSPDDQLAAHPARRAAAKLAHLTELEPRVDVHQRKGQLPGMNGRTAF